MEAGKYPYMTDVMYKLMQRAEYRGWEVVVEPSTGMVITLKSRSAVRVVMGADLGLNSSAAGRLSNDKYFSANMLQLAGLNVIESQILHNSDLAILGQITFPCFIKPNKGSGGDGVSSVSTLREINSAIEIAFEFDSQVLVQECHFKREFRLVVLDGVLLYGYEKRPWQIYGDGQTSIIGFISRYNDQVSEHFKISLDDGILNSRLSHTGKTLATVLALGDTYDLFAGANLKKGASSFPVEFFAPQYSEIVASACAVSGLRYGGVDLFAAQPEVFDEGYRIIEVNANPGFGFLRRHTELMTSVLDSLSEAIFDI